MLKRFRKLHVSLAAKCQILFGAAVVLIIGAALGVPWRRMEQLMDQLNERAAYTLAEQARADHVAIESEAMRDGDSAPDVSAGPTTRRILPTTAPASFDDNYFPPRLIWSGSQSDSRFERRALKQFRDQPDLHYVAQNYEKDGVDRYRYAMRLNADATCLRCHNDAGIVQSPSTAVSATFPSMVAATLPSSQLIAMVSVDIPSQVDAGQLFLNRLVILTAGLIAGTLAIVVFYLITSRLILQPVRVLQETAEKVSEGDLNIRSDINTGDEFQQLSETFNTMLANLKTSADQLRAINKGLDLKLGEMAESNVALYESNRLKSEFLANVSHELRTPLNSILGFAELLRETVGSNPELKPTRYLQNIQTSGKHLLDLINDLLDLAKIEAGKMEVRSEPLVLGDLFEGLANILKPLTEPKGLTITVSVAPDVPILHSDPAKLQQVLYNFLSNAIKFSPKGSIVELIARREGETNVRVSVTDHGPGIETDKQGLIFEKFRQIDGSVTRQHSGSGLGLAISKELIGLLSGTIGLESVPGEGATFWVVLPLKIQAGARDVRAKMVLS